MNRIDDVMLADDELEKSGIYEDDFKRALRRIGVSTFRGAVAGGILRGGFAIFGGLLKKKSTGSVAIAKNAALEAIRWAAFLGSFSAVFTLSDEGIGFTLGKERTKMWRTAAAGFIAGRTYEITKIGINKSGRSRHSEGASLSMYLLVRAILLLIRIGNKESTPKWIRKLLTVTRWEHADTLCMCIASGQILYSWIMMPTTLPPSYTSFLNRHGGKDESVKLGIRVVAERNEKRLGMRLEECTSREVLSKAHKDAFSPDIKTHCRFLHPNQSCHSHFLTFLPEAYMRAFPVYIPVYVIPMLLVHRQKCLNEPFNVLSRTLVGIARSSLFLACYCQMAWGTSCLVSNVTGATVGPTVACCATSGLAVLIEKKSRRVELAVYLLSRALESFTMCLVEWKYLSKNKLMKRMDILSFSVACSVILHCYSHERTIFREKYLNVFDWLFGNYGHEEFKIRHVRSSLLLQDIRLETDRHTS